MLFPEDISLEFGPWLKGHMEEMENLPCFLSSELLKKESSQEGFCCWQARYFYEAPENIESYFREEAPRMRGDLPDQFRQLIEFKRSLLEESFL